jgi:hypothetical protein
MGRGTIGALRQLLLSGSGRVYLFMFSKEGGSLQTIYL